jgi:hypothetical protein
MSSSLFLPHFNTLTLYLHPLSTSLYLHPSYLYEYLYEHYHELDHELDLDTPHSIPTLFLHSSSDSLTLIISPHDLDHDIELDLELVVNLDIDIDQT